MCTGGGENWLTNHTCDQPIFVLRHPNKANLDVFVGKGFIEVHEEGIFLLKYCTSGSILTVIV